MLPVFARVFRSRGACALLTRNGPRNGTEGGDGFVVVVVKIRVPAGLDDDHLADLTDIGELTLDPGRSEFALSVFGEPPLVAIAEGPAAGQVLARLQMRGLRVDRGLHPVGRNDLPLVPRAAFQI